MILEQLEMHKGNKVKSDTHILYYFQKKSIQDGSQT